MLTFLITIFLWFLRRTTAYGVILPQSQGVGRTERSELRRMANGSTYKSRVLLTIRCNALRLLAPYNDRFRHGITTGRSWPIAIN